MSWTMPDGFRGVAWTEAEDVIVFNARAAKKTVPQIVAALKAKGFTRSEYTVRNRLYQWKKHRIHINELDQYFVDTTFYDYTNHRFYANEKFKAAADKVYKEAIAAAKAEAKAKAKPKK